MNVHPRLFDISFTKRTTEPPQIQIACLLCGVTPLECSIETHQRYSHPRTIVDFKYPPLESITILGKLVGPHIGQKAPLPNHLVSLLNSKKYSAAFEAIISFDAEEEDHPTVNPDQFSYVMADLCGVVLKRLIYLQSTRLTAHHLRSQSSRDMIAEERKLCSDFNVVAKSLWQRLQAQPHVTTLSFDDTIRPHLVKIGDTLRELYLEAPDDELTAITLEGLTTDRIRGAHQNIARVSTFSDLPTETAWKILQLCVPTYTPSDVRGAKSYHGAVSSFVQLLLVSKAWSDLLPPLIYHTLVLYARPAYLNRMASALRTHGTLVRTLIIDDLDVYTDIHIQNCRLYIDKCLELSTGVDRIECHGDYQVGLRRSPFSPRSHQIRSVALVLPETQSVDVTGSLAMCAPTLQYLSISRWTPHQFHSPIDLNLRIPQCSEIELHEGRIDEAQAASLLSLTMVDGKSSLRSVSLVGMNFDAPSILRLLAVNDMASQLTRLHIHLPTQIQRNAGNELPIQLLGICPFLVDFSYTSPTSIDIFEHLPPSIIALELAVVIPHMNQPGYPTSSPNIMFVEPIIAYVASARAVNLSRLSVVRQPFYPDEGIEETRMDTQNWDDTGELRSFSMTSWWTAKLREGSEILPTPRFGRCSGHTITPHADWPPMVTRPSNPALGEPSSPIEPLFGSAGPCIVISTPEDPVLYHGQSNAPYCSQGIGESAITTEDFYRDVQEMKQKKQKSVARLVRAGRGPGLKN
ncbi:hypothetical protein DXG01_006643 [Tephrocybe rancida]|nr:hypothetical protein DXG01_006643 [Tephrocybe rancida]